MSNREPHAAADGGGDDRQGRRIDRRSFRHWQVMGGLATTRRDERQIRAIRRAAGRVVPARADLRGRLECTRQGHRGLGHRRSPFFDVVPGVRVVQAVDFVSDDPTHAGTMTMTWEVTAVDAGTRVDIRADDVPAGISAKDHAAGLASSLANLATYLEQ